MEKDLLFLLSIDDENKLIAKKKKNYDEIHNDSCIFFENHKKKYLLTDASFVDEWGYSMFHRIFNIKEFQSISDYISLHEKILQEYKEGNFENDFDDSLLFTCISLQDKSKSEDYFLTLNLIKIDESYNLMFVEGDFDECIVNILKKYILTSNQIEEWKQIVNDSFKRELLKDFMINNHYYDEESIQDEFNIFLESIRNQ